MAVMDGKAVMDDEQRLERSQKFFCVCNTQMLICVCACNLFVCDPIIKFCALAQKWVVSQSLVSEKRSDWLTPW